MMEQKGQYYLGVVLSLCIFMGMLTPCASFADNCENWAGKVVSAEGSVQAKRAGEAYWQPVKLNDTFCSGDMIWVQEKSRADITLINQPVLRLDQNSTIIFGGLKEEKISLIDLIKGSAYFFSRAVRTLDVRTAFVNAGVEGTEFFITVDEDKAFLSIFEGKVIGWNDLGSLTITSGQSAMAEADKAPVSVVVVRPRDAVKWALYYPPIIHRIGEFSEEDPRFYTQSASVFLSVGRVEEAQAEIQKALALDPVNSQAFALQSVIAVTQNQKKQALDLAKKALEADAKSPSALIALSYAQQSDFDLEGARSSLIQAVRVNPDDALAWARLAEIQLSFGELDKSLKAAQKAVSIDPYLSRTQTVLGFSYLTKVKTREATEAFQKAIELDQADPLPRLGLGLTRIRDGFLSDGRREIEVAVSLDPENSLIRSYLGKAYFEEKKDRLASSQLSMAKDFDPLDPTPFFYDAIHKQTINRPVEALHDLQRAIELNDNRAVFRSRLLLDSDLASRSAGLARIYSDLGFQQLALSEGWKSVNTDPGNFSAHRFLADSYAALPRHEIARVSELLQSQLLQPVNITPIQPRLAESNLFVLSGAGPAETSFNEFNPLFNRNRLALQASGIAGELSTLGEEVVVSGLYNKGSISLGQYHYQTDGWRDNSDFRDNIYNTFVQYSLTPKTSFQAEFRKRDLKKGDIELRFSPDDFLPKLRQEEESDLIRFGFNHSFAPDSILLGSFMYQKAETDLVDTEPVDPVLQLFQIRNKEKAYGSEIQHLFKSKYLNLVSGIGYFDIDSRDRLNLELLIPMDPPLLIPIDEVLDYDTRHVNLYIYSHINLPKSVTLTLGGSADFFKEEDDDDQNQFNPKLGITWNPVPDTTLRAAAFRVLKRTLITDQTLEPTQVAGFNQFYDDLNATDSWRYGIAVDQKFTQSLYGGAEYSLRDLEVPFISMETFEKKKVDWEERLGRFYLYWTPHDWVGLSAEYMHEKFKRAEEFTLGTKNIDTHSVGLGSNFYHPSGLSAMLKASYYDQDIDFERQDAPRGFFESGRDRFWLFDAEVNYRLPRRHGFIAVGAKNIFDKSFKFRGTDLASPTIQPKRMVYGKLTLAF